MLNVGIIGYGYIVPVFIEAINSINDYHLRAIFGLHRGEEKLKAISEKYNFDYYSCDIKEMLSDEKIDIVYVATPNDSHYEYAKMVLDSKKHCIIEKPFCSFSWQAEELIELANKNNVFLFEAIANQYLPNYQRIKEYVKELGSIKIIECNYSKYSSRYDKFKNGNILPAFDIAKHGGALMDLNVYNIHFVTGIFGKPNLVKYIPNISNKIDTSGVLIMEYDNFIATCIGGKDSNTRPFVSIQGDKGYLISNYPASILNEVSLAKNGKESLTTNENILTRYQYEYKEFLRMVSENDKTKAYKMLEHSLMVVQILEQARISAQINFE